MKPILLLLGIAFSFQGQSQQTAATTQLAIKELQFAMESQIYGLGRGFLKYLDASATGLDNKGGFTSLAATWKKIGQQPGFHLLWYPQTVYVNSNEEFGVTIGPSFYRPLQDSLIQQTGYYFSVWQRKNAGDYKIIFDAAGSITPLPAAQLSILLPAIYTPLFGKGEQKGNGDAFKKAINTYHATLKTDAKKAFSTFFSEEGQVLLSGIGLLSKPEGLQQKTMQQALTDYKQQNQVFSSDYSFCYEAGKINLPSGKPAYFISVWVKEKGLYKILFQFINPY